MVKEVLLLLDDDTDMLDLVSAILKKKLIATLQMRNLKPRCACLTSRMMKQ